MTQDIWRTAARPPGGGMEMEIIVAYQSEGECSGWAYRAISSSSEESGGLHGYEGQPTLTVGLSPERVHDEDGDAATD